MKTLPLLLCYCLVAINLHSQDQKGVTPVSPNANKTNGTTRAVVIGISNYLDPGIPNLKYAHRDAEAYADYLKSSAGGALSEDQVALLTNENATIGNMVAAIDGLIDASLAGDRAIIYFSGHGDVETKTKDGFLLPYDSPAKSYMAGAYPLYYLQSVISTLSDNNVQVIVITDACHAGALAGSKISGTQKTLAAMQQQFSNEIKVLSCQPDEYSLEGEQWGGGRGVFSYYLINGLMGLADGNRDLAVNLLELGRYLEEKVPAETDPEIQIPMTVGNRTTNLAYVDKDVLARLESDNSSTEPTLNSIGSKGLEEDVLAAASPEVREQYLAFKAALANETLLVPSDSSANALYILLAGEQELAPLHGLMRRNLAAALLNESQQVVIKVLNNDPSELAKVFGRGLYRHIPGYLDRAGELLGPQHYMYNRVKGLQHLFEAYNLLTNTPYPELVILQNKAAIPLAIQALELMGAGAFVYDFLGSLYAPINADSAAYYFKKASQLSPAYASPYNNIGVMYSWTRNPFLEKKYYKKAIKTDPRYFPAYINIGTDFNQKGKFAHAVTWFNKSIKVFPNALAFANLGNTYYEQGRYAEAEKACLNGIELQPTYFKSYLVLANVYKATNQNSQLSALLLKMEALAEARHGDYAEVALGYLYLNDVDRFQSNYYKANASLEPLQPDFFYTVCRTYALQGQKETALNWLDLAFNRGFEDRKKLRQDKALDAIRKEPRFRAMKREYLNAFKITCKECVFSNFKK
ncbi:MAG: caspase family protein [Lewinellaceae bacterium]|nr:caspase family protein [Lewinellaceae bacterium]